MHLTGTILKEGAHIVAQLCAPHDGVVAEHHPLTGEDGAVRDEFHLGHQIAARLVAWSETPWPGGRVFQHGALVGYAMPL